MLCLLVRLIQHVVDRFHLQRVDCNGLLHHVVGEDLVILHLMVDLWLLLNLLHYLLIILTLVLLLLQVDILDGLDLLLKVLLVAFTALCDCPISIGFKISMATGVTLVDPIVIVLNILADLMRFHILLSDAIIWSLLIYFLHTLDIIEECHESCSTLLLPLLLLLSVID